MPFALLIALALTSAASAAPLPSADAASEAPRQTWSLTTRTTDHRTIIYRYIEALGPKAGERAGQRDRITVSWRYDAGANNGMPTDDDKAAMDELEDALAPAVEQEGFANLALVTTGIGLREWTYYARSADEFVARMKEAVRGHAAFPVQVDVAADPDWTAYEAFRAQVVGR